MTLCKRRLVDDVSGRPRHSARARGRGATVASAMRVEHAAAFGVGVAAAAYALWRVSSSRESVVKRAWLGIVVARHPESSSSRERDRVAAEPDPPDGVPADYLCPIGGHVMLDPVLCGCSPSCGKSFDRRSIERWILEGSPSCPVTSRPLDLDKLYPNRTLRSAVETHLAENDVPADVMPPPSFEDSPEAESFRLVARAVAAGEPGPAPDAPTPGSTERRREGYGGEEDDDVPVAELRRRAYAAMEMRRALATEAKKRDGNDENNTPENDTAGHRLRNVSRETRFDGVQRVLLAAGAVEALLDLVRAADGGGRKYTLRDASAGSGSVRGSSPSRARTATVTSAEGSSASRHARLASEDIDARGRPFDETRAVWSSVAVVAAMEALAELCAGSSAAKWKAWSDERFVAATTAALADARAHVQEWSRDGTNVTRALEEAKEAEKHEDEDEEEWESGGAESGGAESAAAEPSRLETPALCSSSSIDDLDVSSPDGLATLLATHARRDPLVSRLTPNGAFWLRRRAARVAAATTRAMTFDRPENASFEGSEDAARDLTATIEACAEGFREGFRGSDDDAGSGSGYYGDSRRLRFRERVWLAHESAMALWSLCAHPRNADAVVRRDGVDILEKAATMFREGVEEDFLPRRFRDDAETETETETETFREGNASPSSASSFTSSASSRIDFRRTARALASHVDAFACSLRATPAFLSRYPPEMLAIQADDPDVGPLERVDPFPHLGDANTGGAVHTDYFAKQLVRLRRAVHEGRLDPADLASRRGAPVSCLASTLRGRRYPNATNEIRAQAAFLLREIVAARAASRTTRDDEVNEANEADEADEADVDASGGAANAANANVNANANANANAPSSRWRADDLIRREVLPVVAAVVADADELPEVRHALALVAWDLCVKDRDANETNDATSTKSTSSRGWTWVEAMRDAGATASLRAAAAMTGTRDGEALVVAAAAGALAAAGEDETALKASPGAYP